MTTDTACRTGRPPWLRPAASMLVAALALPLLTASPARAATYPDTSLFGPGRLKHHTRVDTHATWYRVCMRVKHAVPPPADTALAPAVAGCDAQLRYYDTVDRSDASNADWARVRACALGTRDTAVLMMLYANGLGVEADPALALRYACSTPAAPLEMKRRVNHLARLPQEEAPAFDQCDDATSRRTINICAAIARRRNEHAANARLAQITAGWHAPEKAALARLRGTLAGFADARGRHEADLLRTLGPAYAPAAETTRAAEIERFADDLERFERGRLPKYTAAQYAGLHDRLSVAYGKLTRVSPRLSTDIATSVRQTQQAWARYRAAWVTFGRVRYPSVPAHAWEALLAKRRIKQLRHLARELSKKRR